MKFVSHCSAVFHTFISDFKALVAACEKSENDSLRDKLLCKKNMFNILLVADIVSVLSCTSKCLQASDLLPWEYTNQISNLKFALEIMKYNLVGILNPESESKFQENLNSLPLCFFKNTRLASQMFSEDSTFQGIPMPSLSVSSKKVVNKISNLCLGSK